MYSTEQYIKDTISFTNSLIVKFSGTSISINKGIELSTGLSLDNTDLHTHKYYMNLAGIKHSTNNDVKIKLLGTLYEQSLTKELLAGDPSTLKNLLKFDFLYKDLISNYPDDIDYIRGCMLPVDMDTAINAIDGTILNYASNFVMDNELSLIRDINEYTQSFFVRWYIPEYLITDELYAASIVGSLITTLPAYIINARTARVKTNEVHPFHLEHFFRSRLDIWDQVKILNNETIIWLYMNLDVIIKNIGKNETINTIANKVLDTNGIGVGVYNLKNGIQDIDSDGNLIKHSNYLEIDGVNNSYDINNGEKVSISTTNELQVLENTALGIPADKSYVLDDYISDKLEYKTTNGELTKIIDIDYGTLFKTYGNDLFLSTLDTLYDTTINHSYGNIQTYVDPNSKKVYTINANTGYYIIIYHMLMIAGVDVSKVSKITHTKSIKYDITVAELMVNIHDPVTILPIAKIVHSFIPVIGNAVLTTDEFNGLLVNIRKLFTKVWILDSNVNNANVSGAIKQMVNRIYAASTDTIGTDGDILATIGKSGVILDIGETYDHLLSIKTVFKLFTGNELSDVVSYNNNNDIIKVLVNKLTSYTTNVISSVNDSEPIYAPYSTVQPYNSNDGLLNVTGADTVSPYETDNFYVNGSGDDFKDGIKNFNGYLVADVSYNIEQLVYAYNLLEDDVTIIPNEPVASCEIVNSFKNMMSPGVSAKGDNMIIDPNSNYNDGMFNDVHMTTLQPDVVAYDTEPSYDDIEVSNTPSVIVTID